MRNRGIFTQFQITCKNMLIKNKLDIHDNEIPKIKFIEAY